MHFRLQKGNKKLHLAVTCENSERRRFAMDGYMKLLIPFICLLVHFDGSQGVVRWPDKYYIEGEKIDLIEHTVAPFKMWMNTKDSQMRFEAYKGEIKTHFDIEKSYVTYMEHYKADKKGNPKLVCSEINDDIALVDPLPELDEFELTGKVIHEGKRTQVWTYIDEGDSYRIEQTMLVARKTPIRFVYKKFNTDMGEIEDNYVVKYIDYTRKLDKSVFNFNSSDCPPIYYNEEKFAKSLEYHNSHLAFYRYKNHHNRNYEKDEHSLRKKIFQQNWRLVKEHNSKNLGYTLTLNQFADRTPEEMRRMNSIRPHTPEPGTHPFPHTEDKLQGMINDIPEEFDWRTKGAVSMVKSQGNCGSCWAFATTASIEGALSVKYKSNFDLSEQSIVDCAWDYRVYGCDGGYSERALKYVQDHGIPTETDYGGYLAVDGKCNINNMTRTYKIEGFVAVTPNSVNALKAAVYLHGPVATYVYVSSEMSLYSSGIYYEFPSHGRKAYMVNHVVVVVGYGVRDGELYWIVKNSYGQRWGEDGYILVAAKDNTGSLLYAPYYPLI